MSNPFHDPGAAKLLSKVREDISDLRGDVTKLLTYTTRYTLPKGAREIAGSARQGLSASGSYAKARLNALSSSAPRQAFGILSGAAIVGILAVGVIAFAKSDCCRAARTREEEEEEMEELGI
ncbi:hypothetical protein [Haloferula sp. BvORR071]|uniref:hypothetical protein n=1 Tax=Haloferula sp. BvORR071 TaxID=1396141 RepID=UPI00054EDF47|nr:hypothetical protein [Haloferula sp. BvORR071]